MPAFIDLTGRQIHRLTVIEQDGWLGGKPAWKCQCLCGRNITARGGDLRLGKHRSCGCLQRERASESSTTHGESCRSKRTAEYATWARMIERCENTNNPKFHLWGGRGITICERWRTSYPNFLADMGRRPSKELSIDRIDNDGHYTPENCRWATRSQQMKNKRYPKRTHD